MKPTKSMLFKMPLGPFQGMMLMNIPRNYLSWVTEHSDFPAEVKDNISLMIIPTSVQLIAQSEDLLQRIDS